MTNHKSNYRIYLPIAFSLVLVVGILLGALLNVNNQQVIKKLLPTGIQNGGKVDNIIQQIDNNYVDSVNTTNLETDAIKGMLKDLDPHSAYITAAEFHEINDPLMGSFEGIGIQFRIENDTIMVINTIPGGPSEKVGLMAGDRIVTINDTLAAGVKITNTKAIHKLKGPKGTKVKVSIFRRGLPKLIDFTITRDVIPTYSIDVAYMVNSDLGYIKINKFSATTFREFKKAINKLKKQGMQRLIMDLRNNPGGFLKAAINVADEFLSDGQLIVYTQGLHRPRRYAFATGRGELKHTDVAILINEGSASASEIVTGALQDNDVGVVIGRRSFGKGLVQEQIPFADGSALRLTVARYYTPTGRCIQKPYKKDDFKDYYEEAYKRYVDGELQNPDSIHFNDSLKYVTKGGKVVYGGGGIMPDIYVPLLSDTVHTFYNIMVNKGLVYQFAFDYTDNHRKALQKFRDFRSFDKSFKITDKMYRDLVAYAKEKGIKQSGRKIALSKDKIKILFKAYVGRNLLNGQGFYPIYHKIDTVFKRAVKVMENRKKKEQRDE